MSVREAPVASLKSSVSWDLDQISRLISAKRNPSETLTNIVHEIQRRFATDVCSVYLLEPDRANLVLAATVGLRPESVGRVRMRLSEGLAGLVAQQQQPVAVADAMLHPRFKYFQRSRRRFVSVVPGRAAVPFAASCSACWSCRRSRRENSAKKRSRGSFSPARSSRLSSMKRARSGISPPRHISASPRSPTTCGGAGTTKRPASSASSIRCSGVATGHNPVALLQEIPPDTIESAHVGARAAQPDQLRVSPAAGVPPGAAYLGRAARRRAARPAGRVLLGGVRPARIAADLLRRSRHSRRRSHQERVRPRDSARRRRSLLRPGLLHAAPRSRRLAARRLPDGRQPPAADRARRQQGRADRRSRSRRGPARSSPASGRSPSAATRCCCSIRMSTATSPRIGELTARLYGGDTRVRIRQELLLGVGGVRALAAHRDRAWRGAPERRPQRLCRARARAPPDGGRGYRRPGGDPATSSRVVFTTHTPVPAGHDRFPRIAGGGASRSAARRDGAQPATT